MQLTNKVALVTGGGTGIGRAVCFALAKRGVAVAVNYSRSKEEAEKTAQSILEEGGRAIALQADVSINSEVIEMGPAIEHHFGTIDLLVNNASITHHIPLPIWML